MPTTTHDAAGSDPIVQLQSNGAGTEKLKVLNGGQLQASDGSNSTPSLSFLSDTDTGIYRSSANSMILVSGGSNRLQVYADGTEINSGQLFVKDGSSGAPGLTFSADPDTGFVRPAANNLAIAIGGAEKLRIDSGGNLGIGTSSPAKLLHLESSGNTTLRLKSTGTAENPWDILTSTTDGSLRFNNGSDRITIDVLGGIKSALYKGTAGSGGTGAKLSDRTGTHEISFDWDGTNFKIYSGDTLIVTIT